MILEDITELSIVGTFERGVPNKERIVLRATQEVDAGSFGIFLGLRTATGMALPLRDRFLWLGDALLNEGDWIFIFTSKGEPRVTEAQGSQARIFSAYWGSPITMLQNPDIVPILMRFDGIFIGDAGNPMLTNSRKPNQSGEVTSDR